MAFESQGPYWQGADCVAHPLEQDHPHDAAPVGDRIIELRIHSGPGYRAGYKQTRKTIVLLLCGGDKSTQQRDDHRAKGIAAGP